MVSRDAEASKNDPDATIDANHAGKLEPMVLIFCSSEESTSIGKQAIKMSQGLVGG